VRWAVNVPRTDNYIPTSDGTRWNPRIDPFGEKAPDVPITATRSALARYLTAPPPRNPHPDDLQLKPAAIRTFVKSIEVFPPGPFLTRRPEGAR
jgi:hypothetical protein